MQNDIDKVVPKIQTVIHITDKKCSTGNCDKYGCSDFLWYNILLQFGKYAHNKCIPEWVHDTSNVYIEEFLEGYRDADGCILQNGNITHTTVSYNVAFGIQRLYMKLGKIISVNYSKCPETCTIQGRLVNQKSTYKIRGNVDNGIHSGYIDGEYIWFPIKSIKTTSMDIPTPVYNFEVENDNSYIVENTIVHNCQPFSNGGKKRSIQDKRGLLFDEIIRIASFKKPKIMLLENVKHIKRIDKGAVYQYILSEIRRIGYTVWDGIFSPHTLGIPQLRERIIFVCVRNDEISQEDCTTLCDRLFTSPGIPETVSIFQDIDDIDSKYHISDDYIQVIDAWNEMLLHFPNKRISFPIYTDYFEQKNDESFPKWKQQYILKNNTLYNDYKDIWDVWYEKHKVLLNKRKIYKILEYQAGEIKPKESIWNHFIQIRQSGIRVKKNNFFPTLVAIVQTPIYGKEKRFLTPRECARLQSFPDSFVLHEKDHTAYKQLGNSVNVNVIQHVASLIITHFPFHKTH